VKLSHPPESEGGAGGRGGEEREGGKREGGRMRCKRE